jgi:hypothetical protein
MGCLRTLKEPWIDSSKYLALHYAFNLGYVPAIMSIKNGSRLITWHHHHIPNPRPSVIFIICANAAPCYWGIAEGPASRVAPYKVAYDAIGR